MYLTMVVCGASCTSAIFRELSFGTAYQVSVWPTDGAGTGSPAASNPVTLTTSCPAGACVTLDATAPTGPVTYAASGVNDSLYPVGANLADIEALKTQMWRGDPVVGPDGSYDWSSWDTAVAAGAKTTLVLSDLWDATDPGNPATPWSNWSAYQSWVTATVQKILASGRHPDYWEVYNEPGEPGYYSAANFATVTPALLLQQFAVTYHAIRAADPAAAIIGPSLSHWSDYAGEYSTSPGSDSALDMVTFLNYAAANGLQLAAVSWHENDDNLGPNPAENTLSPLDIVDHVSEARQLIAARPALGNPQVFVNEYGMPEVQSIPGWDVAYLAALSDARVDSAGRSCWDINCANPTLDGLLAPDGTSAFPVYWDRIAYALMSGTRLPASSTNDTVSALGSYDATTGTVSALIGRGDGCDQSSWCTSTWPNSVLAPSETIQVTATVPWSSGSAVASLQAIPGQLSTAITDPAFAAGQTVAVTPTGAGTGTVTVTIPSFADGDAYGMTIVHS